MRKRIYSDAFVDRHIAKIYEMSERNQRIITTPDCLMPTDSQGYSMYPKLSEFERERIKEYYNQFQELSFVRGFWHGWSIRDGTKDERDKQIEVLLEVAKCAQYVPEFDCVLDNYPKQFSKRLREAMAKLKDAGIDLNS